MVRDGGGRRWIIAINGIAHGKTNGSETTYPIGKNIQAIWKGATIEPLLPEGPKKQINKNIYMAIK
jgi:hypothetical protein